MATRIAAARLHLLTAREVQAAGEGHHGDGGGLGLSVRGDSATWVFRYTAPSGRRREMGFGTAPRSTTKAAGATLTAARDLAAQARALLQRSIDPIDARDGNRETQREAATEKKAEKARDRLTLARVAREYHERVIEPTRTTKHAAQWIASLENHMPSELWHAPIAAVTPPALLLALTKIKPHARARNATGDKVPETLSRIRQRLDAVFEDAIFHGRCASNPAAAIRRKLTEGAGPRQRGAFKALPYRDAPAFMQRLRLAEGTATRCLELAVLTTARTSEALLATWSEFDLERSTWQVPAERMKGKEAHAVHLTARAVELLRGQVGQHPALVFPSPMKPDAPMSNMALLTVLKRLGMRDATTVHGLCRSTFSTWANETGMGRPDVIEACLAHNEADRVRAAYNRAAFTQERAALLEAWAAYLAEPVASNVLPFAGRAA